MKDAAMDDVLALMIARKAGSFFVWATDPVNRATETELMYRNALEGQGLVAHHRLPLPRSVIREACQTLLEASRGNPREVEALEVSLLLLQDYGECVVPLGRALAELLRDFRDLACPSDSFSENDLDRAIFEYLAHDLESRREYQSFARK